MSSSRGRILGSRPLRKLHVTEWEQDVYVRKMSAKEKVELTKRTGSLEDVAAGDEEARGRWLAKYFIAVALDETGALLFGPEDETEIYEHADATAVEAVVSFSMRLNSNTRERLLTLGNVSGEALNGASPSASPAISG